ncbi:MAG: S24/S26 family peptidase [Dysgonomonas sp.]
MRTITLPNETLLPEVAKILSEGNMVTLKVKGSSMLPFIIGGRDSVVLQKKETFTIGDIVLAEIAPKHFVLHRIIKIEVDKITLMGDGNLSGTEECIKENISGHTIAIIHKGKHIDCNSKSEQRKAQFWLNILPLRRYLLAIYRRIIL